MKIVTKISLVIATMVLAVGCETIELELLEDPNNLNTESADPNFVLNDIQIRFNNSVVSGYNGSSRGVMRIRYQFGSYNGAVDDLTLTTEWANSYRIFQNIDVLESLSEGTEEGLPYHVGIAQVLEAYLYVALVDFLGDVPFSEANQPDEFPAPRADPGKNVYDAQFELLDAAIANLSMDGAPEVSDDLYYGGDVEKWRTLARTLKLRMYNNIRLTDPARATAGINGIGGDVIDEANEDFQWNYGTEQLLVEARSPLFTGNYQAAGSGTYMSNGLYDMMNAGDNQPPFIETGEPDPRNRYYFYRQTANAPSGSNLPCEGDATFDYCYVGNLYWGRDHTDDSGIPADNVQRSTYGVYPAGGAFDRELFEQARAVTESMEGAGIQPIFLSSFTKFVQAEAALTLGTSGNARTLLSQGIQLSMDKVLGFPTVSTVNPDDNTDYAATGADVSAYMNRVLNEYDSANNQGKLAVIMREYYLAAYGTGIEAYNGYRRTGFPTLQSPVISAGPFPRSYKYPADELSINSNIPQNLATDRVFWDNNPNGFVD